MEEQSTTIQEWLSRLMRRSGFPDRWLSLEACPACGGQRIKPAFTKWSCPHWVCETCSHGFMNPQPTPPIIEEIYNSGYARAFRKHVEIPRMRRDSDEPPIYSISEEAASAIIAGARERGPCRSWLDVGGGFGWFAKSIRDRHGVPRVGLVEIDAEAKQFAEGELKVPSIEQGDSETWDVVSAVFSLEHAADPITFLSELSSWGKKGSTVVVCVPNFTRMNRLVAKASSANVAPPYHLSLFCQTSLEAAASRTGCFDEIVIEEFGGPGFKIIDIVDHADHFDITIPTEENPVSQTVCTSPYEDKDQRLADFLGTIQGRFDEFLEEVDGRESLVMYGRVGEKNP